MNEPGPAARVKQAWSPLRWHLKNHDNDMAQDACFKCQAAKAMCRAKLRFHTREAADNAVRAINEGTMYKTAMSRYPCRWCLAWHMQRARRPEQLRRVEKARRKWLTRGAA